MAEPARDLQLASPAPAEPYVVVARRYRPQSFSELVGQEHVGRALAGAIASGRVGHAYLFTGARGVGKTSAARILAKSLNCAQGSSAQPCGQCDACLGVAAGSDVDVLEIDGASNRGIDEIRELRQNVNVRPSRSRYKIYIIDEVHMLTREAFNALLKTLEEPPEHVKFIFCTTEAEKIPVTILSRCQRFDFAGIQVDAIARRLAQVVAAEGVEAEPAALDLLARRAGGSMRDSQSLLEQLLSVGSHKLTVADVHALLGTADDRRIADLLRAMIERQPGAALAVVDQALAEGVDLGRLLEQLLGFLRDVLVAGVGGGPEVLLHASQAEQATIVTAAARYRTATVLAAIEIVDHALGRLRFSGQARTLVEAALVRLCLLDEIEELGELVAQLRDGSPSPVAGPSAPGRLPAPPQPGSAAPAGRGPGRAGGASDSASQPGPARGGPSAVAPAQAAPPAPPAHDAAATESGTLPGPVAEHAADAAADSTALAAAPTALAPDTVDEVWQRGLGLVSNLVRGQAAKAHRVEWRADDRLAAVFREKYTSCKLFFERAGNLATLEQALAQAAGGRIKLELAVEADEPLPAAAAAPPVVSRQERLAQQADHPLVRKVCELFDARPVWSEDAPSSAG